MNKYAVVDLFCGCGGFSEGFLNAVNPKYAVISVGKGNTYGHPHESTMNRLKAHNIAVYRTDECGTIVAISDGNNITFN